MTQITSVSLTKEEKTFMEDNDLSPTGLLKQKIEEVKKFYISLNDYKMRVEALANRHQLLINFLNERGLYNEFLEQETKQRKLSIE